MFGRPNRILRYALGVEPRAIDDPGNAGAIPVNESGYVLLRSGGGGETRTLADPIFIGQVLDLFFDVDGSDIVITAASPVNQTGNTVITFSDVGEHLRLLGQYNATDGFEWRVLANDGAALSTP